MADEAKEPVKESVKPAVTPPANKPAVATVPVAPPAPKPAAVPMAHTPEGVTLATSKGADGIPFRTLTWRVGDDIDDGIVTTVFRALRVTRRYDEADAVNRACT